MAQATPLRSGDQLAGVAAESQARRVAAQMVLADLPLATFLTEAVVPYEADEVTRLIIDSHDPAAFAPVRHLTVGASAIGCCPTTPPAPHWPLSPRPHPRDGRRRLQADAPTGPRPRRDGRPRRGRRRQHRRPAPRPARTVRRPGPGHRPLGHRPRRPPWCPGRAGGRPGRAAQWPAAGPSAWSPRSWSPGTSPRTPISPRWSAGTPGCPGWACRPCCSGTGRPGSAASCSRAGSPTAGRGARPRPAWPAWWWRWPPWPPWPTAPPPARWRRSSSGARASPRCRGPAGGGAAGRAPVDRHRLGPVCGRVPDRHRRRALAGSLLVNAGLLSLLPLVALALVAVGLLILLTARRAFPARDPARPVVARDPDRAVSR